MALTNEEQIAFEHWFKKYGSTVVAVVRSRLYECTRVGLPTSASAIAQSVWRSCMENHRIDVQIGNDHSAWQVLLRLAWKRTNTPNIGFQRQKDLRKHLKKPLTGVTMAADAQQPSSADSDEYTPSDYRESLETEITARECRSILRELGGVPNEQLERISGELRNEELGPDLCSTLDRFEVLVFALRLAGERSSKQIANELQDERPGLTHRDVDRIWQSIRQKAMELETTMESTP